MKKLSFTFLLFMLLFGGFSQTGAPPLINYQGIARASGGGVLSNATIDVQFNIRQGSGGGSVVFNETHSSVTTNNFGLFTLQIGSVSSLSSVAWGTNKFYLEVLVDAGSGFNPAGPPQELISTPYALYAQQTPPPVVSFTNNVLSVNGSTTAISTGANYGAGTGIAITGSVISNSAPNQTVNISSGNNTSVSGTYPNYTVDVPNSSINYNPATSVLGLTQGSNTSTTSIVIPPATPATSISAGSNVTVSGSAPSYTIDANPNLSLSGNLLSITGGNTVTLPTGVTYTPGAFISITSGSVINNTAPDQTVTITGSGGTTVSGTYPSFNISSPVPVAPNIVVNSPHTTTTLSANNYSINVQPTNLTGTGVANITGAYPTYNVNVPNPSLSYTPGTGALQLTQGTATTAVTIPPQVNPTIVGAGTTTVAASGLSYTVGTPAVGMLYAPATGVLSYSPASGSNTINLTPNVSFTGGTLTVGSNTTFVPGTGLWSPSGGTAVVTSNPSNFVGIGNNNPQHQLQVESPSGSAEAAIVSQNSGGTPYAGLSFGSTSNHYLGNIKYNLSNNSMSFWTNNVADRLFIDGTGNVGLKTNTPGADLHVFNPGSASAVKISSAGSPGGLQLQSASGSVSIFNNDNTNMNFGTSGTTRMSITNAGNVGVGTANPGYKMHVASSTFFDGIGIEASTAGATKLEMLTLGNGTTPVNNAVTKGWAMWAYGNSNGSPSLQNDLRLSFFNGTGQTDAMYFDNQGQIGIGTINPSPTYKLNIFSPSGSGLLNLQSGSGNTQITMDDSGANDVYLTSTLGDFDIWTGGNFRRLTVVKNGNVGINNTSPTATLDVAGTFKLADGTQGANKMLTSDNVGNASWAGAPGVEYLDVNATNVSIGTSSNLGTLTMTLPGPGYVIVHFDGFAYVAPGQDIILAASNASATWNTNNGHVQISNYGTSTEQRSFSHSMYYVISGAGTYTFYAVGQLYIGSGTPSIYGHLMATYFPYKY